MVELLVEQFGALDGKGQQYVNGLARLALENGHARAFLKLVDCYGRILIACKFP